MGQPEYTSDHAQLLDPAFQEIMDLRMAQPREWTRFVKSIDSKVYHPKYGAIGGIGSVEAAPEGEEIQTSNIVDGYEITAYQNAYGIGVEVHDDLILYDMFDKIRDGYQFIPEAMIDAEETKIADLFNSGFSTVRAGGDGAALFSTAHPREDGGPNQANRASTDSDFDIAAYRAAKLQFMDQRGPNGRRIANLFPTRLVVPMAEVMHTAKEILSSPDRPDTANRATNISQNEVSIDVWRYLTDADSWYLLDDQHQIHCLWTQRADKKTEYDAKKRITTSNSRMIFALFFKDWRHTWGSTGA
jgi:hypothetical protein